MSINQALRKAESFVKKGDFGSAEDLYSDVLSKFPNNKRAQIGLASLRDPSSINTQTAPPQAQLIELNTLFKERQFGLILIRTAKLLEHFPRSTFLWNIRGLSANSLGRLDLAIESLHRVTQLAPKSADNHQNLGTVLMRAKSLPLAINAFAKAVKINPTNAHVHMSLATALHQNKDLSNAVRSYQNVIRLDSNFFEAYLGLGATLAAQLRFDEAFLALDIAMSKRPDDPALLTALAYVIPEMTNYTLPERISEIVTKLITETKLVSIFEILPVVDGILGLNPTLRSSIESFRETQAADIPLELMVNLSGIPLLMTIMRLSPIPSIDIESLLTKARARLLFANFEPKVEIETQKFQQALAHQCFLNEYIYPVTAEEESAINEIEYEVGLCLENGKQPKTSSILSLASYKALIDYPWVDSLLPTKEIENVYRLQVTEPRTELVLQSEIPALAEIIETTSQSVRSQYESNPYPRWVKAPIALHTHAQDIAGLCESLELKLHDKNVEKTTVPEILIAGCGTGHHVVTTATRLKNCHVTAIDLSVASLAYAARKTEELELKNIHYLQADILDLDQLDRDFDLVECGGVLHHMMDPLEGWVSITNKLKPGGLMKIALYSKIARRQVTQIRDQIDLNRIPTTRQGMKSFRKQIIDAQDIGHEIITSSADFFSVSGFRDLLFHVQEHQFTLEEIKEHLAKLELDFCGFEMPKKVKATFRNQMQTEDIYDLDLWNTFEEHNPNCFNGMYQFWCQKRLG